MRKIDSTWILSPSDLSEFLACEHLTNSRVAAVNRERNELPKNEGGHTKIVKRRGEEHEIEQIRLLEEQLGTTAFDLKPREGQWPSSIEEMRLAASKTLTAMKEGHRLITQAVIFDEEEPWFGSGDADDDSGDVTDGDAHRFGLVDVLRRVENCKSDLGNFAYEVVEIKLARQIKPKFVHQVEIYSRALAKMQGFSPGKAWLRLGDEVEHPVHLPRYRAVGLRQEGRLRRFVEDPPRILSLIHI